MKVWVTGGLGFIGARVVERLTLNKISTVCVDRRAKMEVLDSKAHPLFKRIMRGASACVDVVEPEMLDPASNDILIHLGAVVDTTANGQKIFEENIDYTRRAFSKFSRIVFASSGAVYGNSGYPDNVYGLTKSVGERMLRHKQPCRSISLRFMNVYGEDEHHKGKMASMPFKLAHAFSTMTRMELHSLDDRRDFIHVDDVASAIVASCAELDRTFGHEAGTVYDVGTGTAVSFQELHDAIAGDRPSVVDIVKRPEALAAKFQKYTCAGKMSHGHMNVFDAVWYKGSKPMPLDVGIKRLVDDLRR